MTPEKAVVGQWISVEERLPETGHDREIVAGWYVEYPKRWISTVFYWDGEEWTNDNGPYAFKYWMPLPEPPKD